MKHSKWNQGTKNKLFQQEFWLEFMTITDVICVSNWMQLKLFQSASDFFENSDRNSYWISYSFFYSFLYNRADQSFECQILYPVYLLLKMGEHVENIKFSLDTQLNFMFSTFSPLFCCLSTRGQDVRKVGEHYIVILVKS